MATRQDTLDAPMFTQVDAVIERTERLLLRHEELTRANAPLQEQLDALLHERETLKYSQEIQSHQSKHGTDLGRPKATDRCRLNCRSRRNEQGYVAAARQWVLSL